MPDLFATYRVVTLLHVAASFSFCTPLCVYVCVCVCMRVCVQVNVYAAW